MAKTLGAVVAAVALLTTVVGCGSDPSDSATTDHADVVGANGGAPVGADGKPLPTQLDGQYEISTPYDLTTSGFLPPKVSSALASLSNFKEHPSQTMIDLMNDANVPAANFLDAIPSLIRDQVLGFIDDHIFKTLFDNVPIAKQVATLFDDVGGLATNFTLVTTLDLPAPDATGNAKAKHTVRGAGYSWDGKDHVLDVPADVRAKLGTVAVDANLVSIEPRSKDLEIGRLQLEKHAFTVPIGSFAIRAMDQLATDHFGADLRGSVGKIIDCDGLGDAVSKKCAGIGPASVCVGHKTEIVSACNASLDLLVGGLKDALKELDLSLTLNLGVAQMWDQLDPTGPLDAKADRLDVGFWKADIKTPSGDKSILSTFTGHRVVDATTQGSVPR